MYIILELKLSCGFAKQDKKDFYQVLEKIGELDYC